MLLEPPPPPPSTEGCWSSSSVLSGVRWIPRGRAKSTYVSVPSNHYLGWRLGEVRQESGSGARSLLSLLHRQATYPILIRVACYPSFFRLFVLLFFFCFTCTCQVCFPGVVRYAGDTGWCTAIRSRDTFSSCVRSVAHELFFCLLFASTGRFHACFLWPQTRVLANERI